MDDVRYYNYCRDIDIMKKHYYFYLLSSFICILGLTFMMLLFIFKKININIFLFLLILFSLIFVIINLNKEEKILKDFGIKYISDFTYL